MLVERRLKQLERWCVFLGVCVLVLGVLFVWSTGVHRWGNIRTQRLEIGPIYKPALVVFSTNPLDDPIVLINDQQGRKWFGITLDDHGNAVIEWFAEDGRTLKRLAVQ
jgi:hypothetical protein